MKARSAMTLAELLIALAIMSVIGLSVAGVTTALSSAHAASEDTYVNIQTGRSGVIAVQHELMRARLVTAAGDDEVLFWAKDTNGDGQMNISEMALLSYDSRSDTLEKQQVVFPDEMSEATKAALDSSVSLSTAMNLSTATKYLANNARTVTTPLAEGVRSFQVDAWPACPLTRLVRLEMAVGDGAKQTVIRSAVALRADRTGYVEEQDGTYVLNSTPTAQPDDDTDDGSPGNGKGNGKGNGNGNGKNDDEDKDNCHDGNNGEGNDEKDNNGKGKGKNR